MQVRKRNGAIVPFDRGFILRAVTLAAAAAGEHDEAAARQAAEQVEGKLRAGGEAIVDIETIQDAVEEALFELGRFKTVKAYILYRMDKSRLRAGWR